MRQSYHVSGTGDSLTWIVVLIYLLTLVFIISSQDHEVQRVWGSDVRALRMAALRQSSSSTSNSSMTTRFKRRASVDIHTPKPMRSQPVQPFYHRRGINTEYEIEPFLPVFVGPEQTDVHLSNLPEAIPLPPSAALSIVPPFAKPIPALPKDTVNVHSLSLGQFDPPRGLGSSIVYSSLAGRPSGPVPSQRNSLPSPCPLGEWPRRDIMQLPVKPKSKSKSKPMPPLPSVSEFPTVDTVTQPRPRRPSGPRLRVPSLESGHRLPPLDLSGISNFETGGRD